MTHAFKVLPGCVNATKLSVPAMREDESFVKAWRNSVNFPATSELDAVRFGLSEHDMSEFTELLSQNNLMD